MLETTAYLSILADLKYLLLEDNTFISTTLNYYLEELLSHPITSLQDQSLPVVSSSFITYIDGSPVTGSLDLLSSSSSPNVTGSSVLRVVLPTTIEREGGFHNMYKQIFSELMQLSFSWQI